MQQVIVDRFRRHQDADARASTLQRLTPGATFVVMFEPVVDMPPEPNPE